MAGCYVITTLWDLLEQQQCDWDIKASSCIYQSLESDGL
jgi:hypothetical protein